VPAARAYARAGPDTWPNFDFLRLAAATLVVLSHAFLIGEGSEAREPFVRLAGPHNALGVYGVHCFFIISGFLVTASLVRSKSPLDFLWRRFLRIYPALIVCLAACALIVGPLFGGGIAGAVRFIGGNLLWPGRPFDLPNVSFYEDYAGLIVNGSLWSLGYEIVCYLLIALIGYGLGIRARTIACASLLFLVTIGLSRFATWKSVSDLLLVLPGFFAGSFLFAGGLHKRRPRVNNFVIIGVSASVLAVALNFGVLLWVFPIAAACPLLLLATSQSIHLPRVRRFGDISYGTYLYGSPVEQVVRAFTGTIGGWALFAIALPLAYLCGYASWRLVERPALRLKKHAPAFVRLATPAQSNERVIIQ
jgi:peptidoglycan/LPS O-acetylase OafA/YrhL